MRDGWDQVRDPGGGGRGEGGSGLLGAWAAMAVQPAGAILSRCQPFGPSIHL